MLIFGLLNFRTSHLLSVKRRKFHANQRDWQHSHKLVDGVGDGIDFLGKVGLSSAGVSCLPSLPACVYGHLRQTVARQFLWIAWG